MKAPAYLAAIFFASAIAGWLNVADTSPAPDAPVPTSEGRRRKPVTPTLLPAWEPKGAETGDLAALETALLNALYPVPGAFSGERLAELCLQDNADDLPGLNAAFSYAGAWASQDPQGMFDWFMERGRLVLPSGRGRHYGFDNTVFVPWTTRNPEAAIAAALACRVERDRKDALIHVIETLRKTDPARAAEIAAQHLNSFSFEQGGGFGASGKDYRQTWDFLAALPAGKGRDSAMAKFLDDVTRYHAEDAPKIWQSLSAEQRQALVDNGFEGVNTDPESDSKVVLDGLSDLLRAKALSSPNPRQAIAWLRTRGREWMETKPAEALQWTLQNLKGKARVTEASRAFLIAAETQFDTALAHWRQLPDGQLRVSAAAALTAGAPADRKEEAEAILSSLPPADRRLAESARAEAEQMRRAEEARRKSMDSIRKRLRGIQSEG